MNLICCLVICDYRLLHCTNKNYNKIKPNVIAAREAFIHMVFTIQDKNNPNEKKSQIPLHPHLSPKNSTHNRACPRGVTQERPTIVSCKMATTFGTSSTTSLSQKHKSHYYPLYESPTRLLQILYSILFQILVCLSFGNSCKAMKSFALKMVKTLWIKEFANFISQHCLEGKTSF